MLCRSANSPVWASFSTLPYCPSASILSYRAGSSVVATPASMPETALLDCRLKHPMSPNDPTCLPSQVAPWAWDASSISLMSVPSTMSRKPSISAGLP